MEPKGEPMVRKEKSVERNYVPLWIPRRGIITVDFALYDRAERYLKEHLGSDTKLRPKAWKAEVADLTAQKDRLYREMRSLKEEVAEAETVKRCVETVLTDRTIPPTAQRREKSKTHDVSL